VGDGDGDPFGADVGGPVVAGRVVGLGVVVVAVRSGRPEGGSYGSLNATDNATATAVATVKQTGARIAARTTRVDGRTRQPMRYHTNAANTNIAAADNHHG
jgi:hypothetical protein